MNGGLARDSCQLTEPSGPFHTRLFTYFMLALNYRMRCVRLSPKDRLRVAFLLGVILVIALAGCSGSNGPQTPEPITATASPATLSDDALGTAGYEEAAVEERELTASGRLDIAGDVQMELGYTIHATTTRAIYRNTGTTPPSLFSILSVPLAKPEQVSATIDPLRDRSTIDLATRAQDTYSEIEGLSHTENQTVTVLGNQTTLERYRASARTDGTETDIYLYVVRLHHEGDILIGIGVGPLTADDPETLRTLVEAIQH